MELNNFLKMIIIIFIGIIIWEYVIPKKTFIKKSKINGNGLFASNDFKVGDIILENIFPHKSKDKILFNALLTKDFDNYISIEGKHINHCSRYFNSDINTEDYKLFQLIATKDIKKGDEITSNYDKISKKLPFIAPSKSNYLTC